MTATSKDGKSTSLWGFLETIVSGDVQPLSSIDDSDPPWFLPGKTCEIDEKTYWYFLELLPPRWMDGDWFAFGEGTGPFRLFWKVRDSHFARELTDDETRTFSQLSGVSLNL